MVDPAAPWSVIAITFTNKAAGELVGRVRAELRAQGLDEESLKIDAAWISTIHSMCRRMLLSHAFDVGIDPGANLLTEDETQALSALALDALLRERCAPRHAFRQSRCRERDESHQQLIRVAHARTGRRG